MQEETDNIRFNFKTNSPSIIKVIGVGGGGGNAVNHMYKEGIHDVSFVLCNTDNQALSDSPIPTRLQLGTEGLGAGNRPERAKEAALESLDSIKEMLNDGTRMVFITAGMGGGTGTGAAPVIAQCAKEMGILTVGIVTIPFRFEGKKKIYQALDGVEEISKHVDALLVINNELLRKVYPDLTVLNAFAKADDTLSIAAKSIAEIVTTNLEQNVDFADVDTTMRDSGVALISIGFGEGEGRLHLAIKEALESTLVNDVNNIYNAKRVAFVIYYSHEDPLRISEMTDIHNFMAKFRTEYEVKWGHGYDDSLGHKIKITILVTGFGLEDVLSQDQQDLTDEEIQAAAEKAEAEQKRREEDNALMERYYGDYLNTPSNAEVVVLTLDELDDDRMIAYMEDTPAYKRTAQDLVPLRGKESGMNRPLSHTHTPQVSDKTKSDKTKRGGRVISF